MKYNWNEIKDLSSRLKGLTTLGVANIVSSAISGVFWFYVASLIGTTHYGEVSYFIAIASIASTVSFLGSGSTIIIYAAKGEKVLSTIFFLTLISSVTASVVLFFMFKNLGVSLYILGYIIFSLSTAEILGRKLYRNYSKYLITQKVLLVVFALGFYYLIGPQGVILGYAVSFFPYVFRFYKGLRESKIELSIIKPKIGFMMNSYMLDLSRTFSGQTDKIIVAPLLGYSLLGNYQLGIQFLSLLSLLPSIVYQYVLPHDASGNPNKKLKRIIIIVSVFLAISGVVLSPIVLPYLFPKFTHAIQVIQIVSLVVIPGTVNLMYISKFLGNEKSKIILIGSGIYLVTQILSILTLGKMYGVNGVATSILLASTAESVYLIIISKLVIKETDLYKIKEQHIEINESSDNSYFPEVGRFKQKIVSENKIDDSFLGKKLFSAIQNPVLIIPAIIVTSLLVRLYYFPWGIPLILDSLGYFWYASDTSILGHLPSYIVANNGWPVFLSLFFSIVHSNNFMDYMMLQRFVTISLSLLTIIPVYFLCKKFFNKEFAVVGAAIFAFEPHIIQNSLLGITEPLYILLITTASALFFNTKTKLRYISFALIAIASLVRVEAMILLIAFSIIFFVKYRKEEKIIIKYGIAIGIFLLIIIPSLMIRMESSGNDSLTSRLLSSGESILSPSTHDGELILQFISGMKIFVTLLGSSLIPVFIAFVPIGAFLIFKQRNQDTISIIIIIICLLLVAFYAYFSLAQDTRYLYPLFPFFIILSLFAIREFRNKISFKNTFFVFFIVGILLLSLGFLHFKTADIKYERESLELSPYVINMTSGINPSSSVSQYIPITEMKNQEFPILSTELPTGPKIISTDGFSSLESYLKMGKEIGLTDLVLDDSKRLPSFLNDVYNHEEKYPYLDKIYDSSEHGYKYHLKIFKINYGLFESKVKLSN